MCSTKGAVKLRKSVFAERLKAVRKKRGKTCMDVALDTGLNQNVIYYWENAGRSPNLKTLVKVADYLDVSIDYLAGRTDNSEINR